MFKTNCNRVIVSVLALSGFSGPSFGDYSFTFDGDGLSWELGWTDGIGNRLGDPLFSGLLMEGISVTRMTDSRLVKDHYAVQIQPLAAKAAIDVFFEGLSLIDVDIDVTFIPVLADLVDLLSIFVVVDVTEWIDGGGDFFVGMEYDSGFVDGQHPLLPGYLVGYSRDSSLDFEDAFMVDTFTGEVTFDQALPFDSALGSLIARTRFTLVPVPSTIVLLAGAIAAMRRRRRT